MTKTIDPQLTARVLTTALPYITRYQGSIIIIKYGGNAMTEPHLQSVFAKDIVLLKTLGIHPVVVHGGGPQVDDMLNKLGQVSQRIDGLRVTDKDTMDVVQMVLGGSVNSMITSLINHHGGQAVGLNGKDANLLLSSKLKVHKEDENGNLSFIDLGFVGDVVGVNTKLLHLLIDSQFIPVIAPIGVDKDGNSYNINADSVAAAIAKALHAKRLLLLTNIAGVMDKQGNIITSLTPTDVDALIKDGTISGGMIPKIQGAVDVVRAGLNNITIVDGRVEHACLLEIFTDDGVGTQITCD